MISNLPPGIILIVGALLFPLLRGRLRQLWLLLLPIASAVHLLMFLPAGSELSMTIFEYELTIFRIDRLSLVWGYIFHIAAILGAVYSLHVKGAGEHTAAASYVGAAIGGVFAGDLITLFIYWELTAVTSVFLIWAGNTERAFRAGMRYVIIQVGSGVLLLAGAVIHYHDTGSLAFGHLGLVSIGTTLIFLAFGIKAAFPLLHNWLQDSYPESTATGTLYLSIFTTKLAIYALARGFAGTECLIFIGAAMTAFPIFFAVIENDLRRVLTYSLNNQLGFMVVGIGIGTELALNGAAAYAF
ncbi:MAG: Na(+)/H(+) antiporter subunit D, partial [bacterium]|nr:Na(+)/H(+) antiporter subunit D [bacterium]